MDDPSALRARMVAFWQGCREVARGASGSYAYDQYVTHCRRHHPERPLPTREEFFRRELTERWDGIRRCC